MSEATTQGTMPIVGDAAQTPVPAQSEAGAQETRPQEPKVFTADYVKELREEAKAHRLKVRELEDAMAKLTSTQKEAEEKKLTEQQQWQELAQKRADEIAEMKAQLEAERQGRLRLEVATEYGLPPVLAARLQGKTKEELAADAEQLKALVPPAAPVTPAPEEKPVPKANTTTQVPGGPTAVDREAQLKAKYFGGPAESPMFRDGQLVINDEGLQGKL